MEQFENTKQNVFWKNAEIPITIGVSAHRNIRTDHLARVESQVRKVISDLRELCPNSPLRMVTGLAFGGDLLCAKIAAEMGVKLEVALPFDEDKYVNPVDFPRGSDDEYWAIRNSNAVVDCFVAPDVEKVEHSETDRDYLFRQQAIYVATRCHVMLALWDGTEASDKRKECGTNAAVGFALKHNYYQQNGMEFYPALDGAVIKIFSPREGRTYGEIKEEQTKIKYLVPTGVLREIADGIKNKPTGERIIRAGSDSAYYEETTEIPAPLKEVLCRTDRYNYDYIKYCAAKKTEQTPDSSDFLMDEKEYNAGSDKTRAIHDCYKIASELSSANKKRNLKAVMFLATMGMLLILAFMLYDQLSFVWTVVTCLAMVGLLVASYFLVSSGDKTGFGGHDRFIEYRALAEALRVQYFMALYGINDNVSVYFTWSHKSMMPWVRKAVIALTLGEFEPVWEADGMSEYYERIDAATLPVRTGRSDAQAVFGSKMLGKWVGHNKYSVDPHDNGQIGYHLNNIKNKSVSIRRRNIVNIVAIVVTLITYVTLFVCELLPIVDLDAELFWVVDGRTLLKCVLSIFTAVTFLITYYYGSQSLDQIQADSINMVRLYRAALDRAAIIYRTSSNRAVCDAAFKSLLCELAREQLIENVTWVAYNRDNNISMPL